MEQEELFLAADDEIAVITALENYPMEIIGHSIEDLYKNADFIHSVIYGIKKGKINTSFCCFHLKRDEQIYAYIVPELYSKNGVQFIRDSLALNNGFPFVWLNSQLQGDYNDDMDEMYDM